MPKCVICQREFATGSVPTNLCSDCIEKARTLIFHIPAGSWKMTFSDEVDEEAFSKWFDSLPLFIFVDYKCEIGDRTVLFHRVISDYKPEWVGEGRGYNSGDIEEYILNVMLETGCRTVKITADNYWIDQVLKYGGEYC